MSATRGTSPEYPDVPPRYPTFYPLGHGADHTQREVEIAEERSRQDEALRGHKKPSFWKRLLGRS